MIVDDNNFILQAMISMAKQLKMDVEIAPNGSDAVDMFKAAVD